MRIAFAAHHFRAVHEETAVGFGVDVFLRGRRPEARPASAGIKLLIGAKQGGAATHTAVYAGLVIVPIASGEGSFGAFLARHREFLGRKLLLPFGVALHDLSHCYSLPPFP